MARWSETGRSIDGGRGNKRERERDLFSAVSRRLDLAKKTKKISKGLVVTGVRDLAMKKKRNRQWGLLWKERKI